MEWISIVGVAASLAFGIVAFFRAGRAEARAEKAESRAHRMEAREIERSDVHWEFGFVSVHTFQVVNRGLDTAHDVVVVIRFDQGWDELRADEFPRNVERAITTSAGVEATNAMEELLRDNHRQGLPMWTPEVTVPTEVRITWRTALGTPKWEAATVNLSVPLTPEIERLNVQSDHVGRIS